MTQRNIIILITLITIILLAFLSTLFVILWNKSANPRTPARIVSEQITTEKENSPDSNLNETLLNLLIPALKEKRGYLDHDFYTIRIQKTNERWMRGILEGHYNEDPTEIYNPYDFLAKKMKKEK